VITSPQIDIATVADIPGLTALRIQQEWWERGERLMRPLLAWDGAHMFTIRAGALDVPLDEQTTPTTPIAVVGAIAAGATGVIGNVVVRADYQRRGLARRLMRAALDWQRERGVRTSWLDATVDGRSLYRGVGFADCEPSYYAKTSGNAVDRGWLERTAGSLWARLAQPEEIARAATLDTAAFGGDRMPLLVGVLREPETWLYLVEAANGDMLGYLMARTLESPLAGIRAGSWVATSDAVAAALLAALLAEDAPWRAVVAHASNANEPPVVLLSPPGNNPAALTLLRNARIEIIVDDLIMRHDFADASGVIHPAAQQVDWLYGWLAAMVF
jgi:ribosomal protein S18 acetylase RimI-like enzyme